MQQIDNQKTRFARPEPQASICDITPRLAEELLGTSIGNRKIKQWYVDVLKAAQIRGEWRVTSQGVGIDKNGNLLDGHHRLRAIAASQVTTRILVVAGLDREAYAVIDTGMKRSFADRMAEDRHMVEIFRLAVWFAYGERQPSVEQMRAIADAGFRQAADLIHERVSTRRKIWTSTPVRLAIAVHLLAGRDSGYLLDQYHALVHGRFDHMSPVIQSFYRQGHAPKTHAIRLKGGDTRELFYRAMRAFEWERRSSTKLQMSKSDPSVIMSSMREIVRSALSNIGIDPNSIGVMPNSGEEPGEVLPSALEQSKSRALSDEFSGIA